MRRKLKERIEFVHEQIKSDALVEEYIEGRELYVGVIGNERLTRLPVWEMVFGSMPDSLARHRHAQGEVGQALPGEATASPPTPRRICRRRYSPPSTGCRAASIGRSACPAMLAWTSA